MKTQGLISGKLCSNLGTSLEQCTLSTVGRVLSNCRTLLNEIQYWRFSHTCITMYFMWNLC